MSDEPLLGDGDALRQRFPFHVAVWENDIESLKNLIETSKGQINTLDPHGRTPLHLATILGYTEAGNVLLENGADANTQDKEMWMVSHDAVCLADPPYLAKVLSFREYQRALQSNQMMAALYESLINSDDFYVEMGWEFNSWLPFVKNMCPSDTYKIYKSGTNIRIDASLLGFDNSTSSSSSNWRHGRQSFIFRFSTKEQAEVVFIDHAQNSAQIQSITSNSQPNFDHFNVHEETITEKLLSPVTTTYINIDNVGFERSKSFGLFSWIGSNAKEENIEGYTCRVFNASNLEVVTKTRVEHLRDEDKSKNSRDFGSKPVSLLMGLFEKRTENNSKENSPSENGEITLSQYLGDETGTYSSRIGRPRQEVVRKNSFNASLWLADSFPLKLQDQIFPIIDLMAIRNSNFSRLKSFIQLQLPSGFPVRINIPLFHMINAQVTFRMVNEPEPSALKQEVGSTASAFPTFELDPSVFEIPAGYATYTTTSSLLFEQAERPMSDTSISDDGTVDLDDEYVYLLERFMAEDGSESSHYRQQLQRAIEESLAISGGAINLDRPANIENDVDPELLEVLEMSKIEEERRLEEDQREDEELKRALELSLIEQ